MLGVAKSTISSDQALKRATSEMNQARELCDALRADQWEMASLKELIKKSRDYLEVATNLSEENTEMQRAMLELLEEIRELTDEKFPGKDLDAFASWLSKQWCAGEGATPNFSFTDFSDIKDILPLLHLRGWCSANDGIVGLRKHYQSPAMIFFHPCSMVL